MNHHEQVLHEYTYTVVTYKYTEMSLRSILIISK